MKISVRTTINAAHRLPGTELHGHTYRITATHTGTVASTGMVTPFDQLQTHLRSIVDELDHRQLESVIGEPATAEHLAMWIKRQFNKNGYPEILIRIDVGDDGSVEV